MHSLTDLRTGSHQRMTVDHCSFIDIGTGIHKHRRHTNHTRCDVSAIANTRTTRNNSDSFFDCRRTSGIGLLIEEAQRWSNRHVCDLAHSKAEQDALLDPTVYAPFTARTSFGGSNLASIERVFELIEQPTIFSGKLRGFLFSE